MESLQLLLKHAEEERDRALGAFQLATTHQLAAEAQHEQLLGYRRDYEARWQGQFSQQGQIELVRCYHAFMVRLDQAVQYQQAARQQTSARLDEASASLREREIRVASVRKLMARRHQRERSEQARREQKLTDERGARPVQDSAFPHGMASTY